MGDFSSEVLRSIGAQLEQHSCGPASNSAVVVLPGQQLPPASTTASVAPAAGNPPQLREPDSGISSARSTATVPWTNNEPNLPTLSLTEGGELIDEHQLWINEYMFCIMYRT